MGNHSDTGDDLEELSKQPSAELDNGDLPSILLDENGEQIWLHIEPEVYKNSTDPAIVELREWDKKQMEKRKNKPKEDTPRTFTRSDLSEQEIAEMEDEDLGTVHER